MSDNLTLEDIARLAGVSRSTVSRVINDQSSVSEGVRQRVRQVIEDTGFHPNQAARALASQRTYVIGLVIPRSTSIFFSDPYFPRLTMGIAEACNRENYTLSLFLFHTEDDETRLFPRITRKGLVDGIIIQATQAADELFAQVRYSNVPYIVAGRPLNLPDVSYVDVDNVAGAHSAVRHLVRLGRRRIGHIAGPLNTTAGLDRIEGYRIAMNESGLPIEENLIAEGDFTEEGGYYAARSILAEHPDAIFIAADLMAAGAIRAIREAGLSVPRDIAIVSYDDLPPATLSSPPLTTIRQPIRRLGIRLVETLLDIIENGPKPTRRVLFDTELVIRDSCGERSKG
ncbi:MAG: LacI family DNA-binding transcriptional regulator [Anaerolineales bacterium]|nr:LacI family DNA-binding transcriptional regulator [Anaerolineales bacterium]